MAKNYLIADIIPLIPLPSNSPDFFSYYSDKKIKPGGIVEIDFKKKKILGYVYQVTPLFKKRKELKDILEKIKPIKKVINENSLIGSEEIKIIQWLSNYFGFSLSSAFSYFFLYKKILPYLKFNISFQKRKGKRKEVFLEKLEKKILENKKSLILVPEISFIEEVKKIIEKFNLSHLILKPPFDLPKIENVLERLLKEKELIIISPKTLIFFPWKNLDQIIIYKEGLFFYYDSFKNINFDYRKIIKKTSEIKNFDLVIVDNLPSFETIKDHNPEIKIELPIKKILNNLDEVLLELKNFQKVVIFVPQKFVGRGLVCQNCFYVYKCPFCENDLISEKKIFCPYCLKEIKIDLNRCPQCNQENTFGFKKIGALGLSKLIEDKNVFLLTKKRKKLLKKISNLDNFIIFGSLSLISGFLPNFDALFFFNFEDFYLSSDPFLREKFIRILNFFKEKTKNIFLISSLRNPKIEKELINGEIIKNLINERKILNLPPYKRIIKLIKGAKNFYNLQNEFLQIANFLKNELKEEIIGPIFSKPFKKRKKTYLEIIIRTEKENIDLKKFLNNLPGFEKIKIDPLEI